jgi:peroxiredoxin Q/BCP
VWGEKKFMGKDYLGIFRTTFLIDETGKIKAIIDKPQSKNHAQEVLQAWENA